jgi:mannose-6-phosphate isomerase-like protein (cupin superfamily)
MRVNAHILSRAVRNSNGGFMNATPCVPFRLQDSLIAYGDDLHVLHAAQSLAELRAQSRDDLPDEKIRSVLGIFEFHDDDSVHADHWECHPTGDESLCVLKGRLLIEIDFDGVTQSAVLGKGQAIIVPRGRWHRLRVVDPGRLLFFTPAAGTTLRPVAACAASATGSMLSREECPS